MPEPAGGDLPPVEGDGLGPVLPLGEGRKLARVGALYGIGVVLPGDLNGGHGPELVLFHRLQEAVGGQDGDVEGGDVALRLLPVQVLGGEEVQEVGVFYGEGGHPGPAAGVVAYQAVGQVSVVALHGKV